MNNQNSLIEVKKEFIQKFPDEEGVIEVRGVKVKYTFKNNYFGSGICNHIDFRSVIENTPNPITETGYRSHFFYPDELVNFNTFKDFLDHEVKNLIEVQNKMCGRKEVKVEKSQGTLF